MRAGLIVILVLFQGLAVAATASSPTGTIYRTTDANGNVVFTDSPAAGRDAEPVELAPTNTVPLSVPDQEAEPKVVVPADIQAFAGYQSLRIVSPDDNKTLRNPNEPIAVRVTVAPPLQPGDRIRVRDNGTVLESGSLTRPERGAHTLQAEVVGPEGQVLIQSPAITVYVHRASVAGQGSGNGGDGSGVASFGSAARPGGTAHGGSAAGAGSGATPGSAASPGDTAVVPVH